MCLQLHKRCGRGDPAGPLAQYRWDGIVLSRLGRDKGTRRRGGYPILRVHFTAALLYRAYHWGKKEGKEKCGSRVHTRFLRTLWRRAKFNDQALFLVCACAAKKKPGPPKRANSSWILVPAVIPIRMTSTAKLFLLILFSRFLRALSFSLLLFSNSGKEKHRLTEKYPMRFLANIVASAAAKLKTGVNVLHLPVST